MGKKIELKRSKVRVFIQKHPLVTYKDIKTILRVKVEKIYSGGIKEAFQDAGVKPPRSFEIKSKEEKRRLVIDYIRKHPRAGVSDIRKKLKISTSNIFISIKEAYALAGIDYPRKESYKFSAEQKRKELIMLVRENPNITLDEISNKLRTNPYHLFKNLKEIYSLAGVDNRYIFEKRKSRKKLVVLEFIKKNPLATQREINKECGTKVQELFNGGIFEAYNLAGVKYPYLRLNLHGSALKEIKTRANDFEELVAIKLSGYGRVNRLMKTKRGVADIVFERKNKKAIIEVKDYLAKDISISEVKQLNRYLEDCNCNLGFLICHDKPKKDKFLIGKNEIILLNESELIQVPQLMDLGS